MVRGKGGDDGVVRTHRLGVNASGVVVDSDSSFGRSGVKATGDGVGLRECA